jgi:hypothetical protein
MQSVVSTLLALFLSAVPLFAAEPVSVSRSAGEYRVTITLADETSRDIGSIAIIHGKERFTFPASLFNDIHAAHIGAGFNAAEFRLEVKGAYAVIRVLADNARRPEDAQHPDEHIWHLSLPLKEASRIGRQGDETGFAQRRPATLLSR